MEDELAASLDQDFHIEAAEIEDEAVEPQHAVAEMPVAVEPVAEHEFDDTVALSLEDELMLDDHSPDQRHAAVAAVDYPEPVPAADNEAEAISDDDFDVRFEAAMADVDMDFDVHADEPVPFDAAEAYDAPADAMDAREEFSRSEAVSDDDFDLNLDDAFAEPAEEPAAEVAAAVQPTAPAAIMAEPAPAAAADERILEDELNALLGAMTARTSAKEPVAAQPVVAQPVAAPVQPYAAPYAAAPAKAAEEAADLDWDLDEHATADPHASSAAHAADADLNDLLVDELQGQDLGADRADHGDIDLDDDAFDAALARSLDPRDEAASQQDQADSLDWLA